MDDTQRCHKCGRLVGFMHLPEDCIPRMSMADIERERVTRMAEITAQYAVERKRIEDDHRAATRRINMWLAIAVLCIVGVSMLGVWFGTRLTRECARRTCTSGIPKALDGTCVCVQEAK